LKAYDFYLVRVYLNDESIDISSIQVKGMVDTQQVMFKKMDHGYWEYKQFEIEGKADINFDVQVNYKRGLIQTNDEKIAQLTLTFPIDSQAKVMLTKPVQDAMEIITEPVISADETMIDPPVMKKKELGEPELVLGFNKLVMPDIDMVDEAQSKEPMQELSAIEENTQAPVLEDQWGEEVEEVNTDDKPLNIVTILLVTTPLVLVLGAGIWWVTRLSKQTDLDPDVEPTYTKEEQEALNQLDKETIAPIENDLNEEAGNNKAELPDENNEPLNEPIDVDIDLEGAPELDVGDEPSVEDDLAIDVQEDMALDAGGEPALDAGEEMELDAGGETELGEQTIDKNDGLESEPVEDAVSEFEKQIEEPNSSNEQSDPLEDEMDPFEEIESDPLDSLSGDESADQNDEINENADFDIGADEFDELNLDQDDNPFEEELNQVENPFEDEDK